MKQEQCTWSTYILFPFGLYLQYMQAVSIILQTAEI